MERILRVVLFVVLAAAGLSEIGLRQQLDALKPPKRANALAELIAAYSSSTPPPRPPAPPPPPAPFDNIKGDAAFP